MIYINAFLAVVAVGLINQELNVEKRITVHLIFLTLLCLGNVACVLLAALGQI